MHDILLKLEAIFVALKLGLQIKKIEVGPITEAMARSLYQDCPLVVISGDGEKSKPGPIADHQTEAFTVTLWIMHGYQKPINARIKTDITNQYPTLSELSDQFKQEFGKDKKLGGVVTGWHTTHWDVADLSEPDSRLQIRKVTTSWEHMIVPDDGRNNNQLDMARA